MYEDEYAEQYSIVYDLNDNLSNSEDSSVTDENTISSQLKKRKNFLKELKKTDKGYHKIKKFIDGKLEKIEFYHTDFTPGTCIRNAITGTRNKEYRTGTRDEDLFFKVIETTVKTDKRDPLFLFFDCPEDWERHFKVTCSQDIKNKWHEKFQNEWRSRGN